MFSANQVALGRSASVIHEHPQWQVECLQDVFGNNKHRRFVPFAKRRSHERCGQLENDGNKNDTGGSRYAEFPFPSADDCSLKRTVDDGNASIRCNTTCCSQEFWGI